MAQKQDWFVDFEVREYQVSTSVPHLSSKQQKSLSLLPPFRLDQLICSPPGEPCHECSHEFYLQESV